ncbi:MAG: HEAT repeat domain-containing protein [Planctomycetota bacterium]
MLLFAFITLGWLSSAHDGAPQDTTARSLTQADDAGVGTLAHEQAVMRSSYCATCHAAIYAEHEQNTHGRAFTDEEVRLATGRFSQGDCIICHTPRPVFETGIGQNPVRRHFDLEEGNTCMTCHWAPGKDYSAFVGGADCVTAFDDRVGEVESCASCHRNHGTPFQWALAPRGQQAGNDCIDCHMPLVERPVAVGGPVRSVRSHTFPASRSESQLRRAYDWDARIEGNEVIVTVENKGAGHNFPTELKQRSIESLIVVRDADGREVARSRMTFRDPYKRPYGLTLQVNTQIPSGESRQHRVPLGVASGTVDCELHYKLYYPIEDHHPDLARQLEDKVLPFDGIVPNPARVESEPDVRIVTPDGISPELASPANLVDYARPAIGAVDVDVPTGDSPEDIERLIALFQFPVVQANILARKRLVEIGAPAIPALVSAMGSWDNKTWNQAMAVLERIGAAAIEPMLMALESDELYVRLHASEMLTRLDVPGDAAAEALLVSLTRPNALDRAHAAEALGARGVLEAEGALRQRLLEDRDPDVVRAAARALAQLSARDAAADLRVALKRFPWLETQRDIAEALARLGDPSGVPVLLAGLDTEDDLVRESCFEALHAVTGMHFCYDPLAPRDQRLASLAALQAWWAKDGGAAALRQPMRVPYKVRAEVKHIVEQIGGSDGSIPDGNDDELRARLLELGPRAIPGLVGLGLKYPPGFQAKRSLVCDVLGEYGHSDAVPGLVAALRDPVVSVAAWANDALGRIGDPTALPAVQRYHSRLQSLQHAGQLPAAAGPADLLLAQAAATRFRLGDTHAESDLTGFLLSDVDGARYTARKALVDRYGAELDYDADAPPAARRAAVGRWLSR